MIDIQIFNFIDLDHQDSLWYGGHVATVTYGDLLVSLYANGDVYAHLCSVDNDGAYNLYVKDKNNAGEFYGEMRSKIKNDDELHHALQTSELSLDYGNWWEIFVEYKGKDIGFGDEGGGVLNASSLNDAISEVIGMLDWIEDCCRGGDNNGVCNR